MNMFYSSHATTPFTSSVNQIFMNLLPKENVKIREMAWFFSLVLYHCQQLKEAAGPLEAWPGS